MAANKKMICTFITAFTALTLLLSGCASNVQPASETAAMPATETVGSPASETVAVMPAATEDQAKFAWGIQVKAIEKAGDMSATKNMQQYNGDVTAVALEKKPGDGNVFLLLDLAIDKQSADAASFAWSKLSVQDADGVSYARMENDTFLNNFNYNRIKSIDLSLGKNEGYACFEISKASAGGALYLVYQSPQGEDRIQIQ